MILAGREEQRGKKGKRKLLVERKVKKALFARI